MSIYVLNIATMLGLALAIDYSLFIVSRFREELRRGRTVGEAVERAVATAGKAVAFSGSPSRSGLSGLLLFEAPAIRSIGIAGALVVLCSVVFALTFLPAVLGCSATASNALCWAVSGALPAGRRRRRDARTARWERVARAVMRHPIAVLVPTLGYPARRRQRRSCASSRACPAPRSTRRVSRAGMRMSRSRPSSPPARRRRSSSSPTSRAPRPTRRRSRPSAAYAATMDGDRGDRPGRGPVHPPRPRDRRAPDPRAGRRALRPAGRPASAPVVDGPGGRPAEYIRGCDGAARRDQPARAVPARRRPT